MADYFDEVESEVREVQRAAPDVVLPWSWWQERGERHGMSPNAIYTRAVKVGLYVPPAKRDGNSPVSVEIPVTASSTPAAEPAPPPPSNGASPRLEEPPRRSGPEAEEPPQRRSGPEFEEPSRRRSGPAPLAFESGGLGAAVQNFASCVERTAHLERQVDDLTRGLDSAKRENRRFRRALREMEELSSRMAQVFRNAVMPDE